MGEVAALCQCRLSHEPLISAEHVSNNQRDDNGAGCLGCELIVPREHLIRAFG